MVSDLIQPRSALTQLHGGPDIFFEGHLSIVDGQRDIAVHPLPAPHFGVAAIKGAYASQDFVGPVAAGLMPGKPEPVGKQHRVPDDLLGGIQVLSQQGGRHHQSLAGIGKPLSGGSVDGKLPGRLQIHPQKVP